MFQKLYQEFKNYDFINIINALNIKDDEKIKKLMECFPTKDNEDY